MIKTPDQIKKMRDVCKVTSLILSNLILQTRIGDTGFDVNKRAMDLFVAAGVEPAFKGLYGFPAVMCISVNESLIHGIPDTRPFEDGDVVKYDIGARLDGFCSDMARTFVVGMPNDSRILELIADTRYALDCGIAAIRPGATLWDVAVAIETVASVRGYGNLIDFHGHGIGESVHEEPAVHNATRYAKHVLLKPGMTLALEPMFTLGSSEVLRDPTNPWMVRAVDGSLGAHFEDTVLVLPDGQAEVLTR